MTMFFFHVRDRDGNVCRDTEGEDLPDLEAAKLEAENSNREMLGENLLHGRANPRQVEIANAAGQVLAVVKARDVLMRDDQPRLFKDDVTKSAPVAIPIKPGAR
jgi:hypothetical protein